MYIYIYTTTIDRDGVMINVMENDREMRTQLAKQRQKER